MMQMDRETLMMVATVVCIAAVIFLFREMNKTKVEVENFRNFSNQLVHQLSGPMHMEDDEGVEDEREEVVEKGAEKLEE
jgi:hypothetical protein